MSKKTLIFFFLGIIIITLIIIFLLVQDENEINKKFFGLWESETGFYIYEFFPDGKCILGNSTATWSIDNGKIICEYDNENRKNISDYEFSDDYSVLKIAGMSFYKIE